MEEYREASLTIKGNKTGSVRETKILLADIENAYLRLVFLEEFVQGNTVNPFVMPESVFEQMGRASARDRAIRGEGIFFEQYLKKLLENRPLLKDELFVEAVKFSSPGFWEFIGRLNPLEVLRVYLNDRHERMKDKEWRSAQQKRKMELENETHDLQNRILKTELIQKAIKVAYDSGATDEDVALLIREMVLTPLMNLNSHQNSELITKSKISVPKKETHEVT